MIYCSEVCFRMKSISIHEGMTLSCPDSFRVMTLEELNKISASHYPNRFGIWDEEAKVMLSFIWHKINVMAVSLTDPRRNLYGVEMQMRHMLQPFGYKKTGSQKRHIAGRKAKGFSYEYQVNGQYQSGEVFLFKNGRNFYTLYTYAWEPMEGEVQEIIHRIVDSIRFQ